MRELKFRAWDKAKKKWVDVGFHIMGEIMASGLLFKRSLEEWKDVEISQWTGLKDCHGKEIYEGDIIIPDKASYCQGLNDGDPVTVEWLECGGWYPFADDQDGMVYPNPVKSVVIGNIYENK